MKKFGSWTEQETAVFRTSGDNKVLTISPPSTLSGASSTLTLPDISSTSDNLVSRTSTDTLTNKTLTSPVISQIVNTGTLTLPTSTDTLVGRDTTDTLTNKTIDGDTNTVQDLALSSLKTTGNINVFVQRDGSGNVIDSSKSVPTGAVIGTTDAQTLTNKTIDADNNTISNIDNNEIKAAAAIALNKLASVTGNRALASDVSGFITASAVTDTELGYLSGVTSAIQTQIDNKQADVITTRGDVIYGNISGVATRLPIGTAGQVLTSDGTDVSWDNPAGTGDVTAASTITDNALVRGDGGAKGIQDSGITITDTNDMSGVVNLTTSGTVTHSALNTTGIVHNNASGVLSTSLIVNADVDAAAAIAGSKINPNFGSQAVSGVTTFTSTGDMTVDTDTFFVDVSTNRVGIGNTTPGAYLDIVISGTNLGNSLLNVEADTGAGTPLATFYQTSENFRDCIEVYNNTTPSTAWVYFRGISDQNNDDAGTTTEIEIQGNGDVQGSGTYGTLSDERLKENIHASRNYLEDLNKIDIVKYSLKKYNLEEADRLGVIAQQVEKVFPNMVKDNVRPNGSYKSVKDSVFIYMLIKAVQELTGKINKIEEQLK